MPLVSGLSRPHEPPHLGRRQFWRAFLPWVALAAACVGVSPLAAQFYWDTNGKTAGAGGTSPAGTWNTTNSNKVWNSSAAGTNNATSWTAGSDAVFSAGGDATGAYTVTVSGTQSVSSITVGEGSPTLATGTINFSDASPDLLVAAGSTLTFGSAPTSTTGNLNVGSATFTGTTVFSANTTLAGTLTLGGGTLQLAGSSYTFGTLNVTGDSTLDFAGATTLNLTSLTISAGVVLTIQNWTQASDFFFTSTWSGAIQDLPNNGNTAPLNQVQFNGFGADQTGWDSLDNQIRPNVPEPSTYGAILMSALVGWFAWRRLVRRPTR